MKQRLLVPGFSAFLLASETAQQTLLLLTSLISIVFDLSPMGVVANNPETTLSVNLNGTINKLNK